MQRDRSDGHIWYKQWNIIPYIYLWYFLPSYDDDMREYTERENVIKSMDVDRVAPTHIQYQLKDIVAIDLFADRREN